jgi:hypothetical protein
MVDMTGREAVTEYLRQAYEEAHTRSIDCYRNDFRNKELIEKLN